MDWQPFVKLTIRGKPLLFYLALVYAAFVSMFSFWWKITWRVCDRLKVLLKVKKFALKYILEQLFVFFILLHHVNSLVKRVPSIFASYKCTKMLVLVDCLGWLSYLAKQIYRRKDRTLWGVFHTNWRTEHGKRIMMKLAAGLFCFENRFVGGSYLFFGGYTM